MTYNVVDARVCPLLAPRRATPGHRRDEKPAGRAMTRRSEGEAGAHGRKGIGIDVAAEVAGSARGLSPDAGTAIGAEVERETFTAYARPHRAPLARPRRRARHRAVAPGELDTRAAVPGRGVAARRISRARVTDVRRPTVLADTDAAVDAAVALGLPAIPVARAGIETYRACREKRRTVSVATGRAGRVHADRASQPGALTAGMLEIQEALRAVTVADVGARRAVNRGRVARQARGRGQGRTQQLIGAHVPGRAGRTVTTHG